MSSGAEFSSSDRPIDYAGAVETDGGDYDHRVVYRDAAGVELDSPVERGIVGDVIVIHGPTMPEAPTPLVSEERLRRARAIGGIGIHRTMRQQREAEGGDYRSELDAIEASLKPLYEKHPYLAPDHLQIFQAGDSLYRQHTRYIDPAHDYSEPEGRLWQLVHADPHAHPTRSQRAEIAALTAAASVRKHRGANSYMQFQGLLKTELVDREAANYVTRNLVLFRYHGVSSVSDAELGNYDGPDGRPLSKEALARHHLLADLLAGTAGAKKKLIDLQGPPLVITQLATDIRNHNADSVMPKGFFAKHSRLSGRPQQFINQTEIIDTVIATQDEYLRRRYQLAQKPSARVLSALAEIDLAERQGFQAATIDEQYRTAYRVRTVFRRVKREQLPADAQAIFDRCQAINTVPRY